MPKVQSGIGLLDEDRNLMQQMMDYISLFDSELDSTPLL